MKAGTATAARRYAELVAGTGCQVLDTRKTTPGWRVLDKYAVRAGGGMNHRQGLFEAILIKDNHLALGAQADAGHDQPNHLVCGQGHRVEVNKHPGQTHNSNILS